MSAPKYKEYYQKMRFENVQAFDGFKVVHDEFRLDRKKWRKQFDELGKPVVEILRTWEGKLCFGTEKGQFAKYSHKLSDKFWEEVKKEFPLIELVGVESSLG